MCVDALVVGSGPAGVAAASALLRRGRRVLMVDGGLRLEPERQALVQQMAGGQPAAWRAEQLAVIKEGMEPGNEGIPLKRMFGSDFPFRETAKYAEVVCRHSDIKMSLALGGLSNVWGAGAVPFCADDISDWPVSIDALAPFYRETLEEMELAAVPDDLAHDYPLYTERCRPLQASRQAVEFLADLDRHRAALRSQGIAFGVSRLAVRAAGPGHERGCVYCGLCLYGCPYGYIYNSSDYVQSLLRTNQGFRYQGDVVVERVEEAGGGVTAHARHRRTGEPLRFSAGRVFLACGAIPTTAILLESLGAWDRPLVLKDSQYFLCPMLRFRGTRGVESEQLHALAQVFLEVRDPRLSRKGIHLSVYTYNDLMLAALQKQAGPLGKVLPAIPRAMARRLLILGGYLHSNESPAITLTLARSPTGARQVLLQGGESPASAQIFRRLIRKLTANSFRFKAVPLAPVARPGLPGRGFHVGGTFPMSHTPGEFESDVVGRPTGFSRVHAVDATVFPSVPAPNLTLSVMANARRMVAAACES